MKEKRSKKNRILGIITTCAVLLPSVSALHSVTVAASDADSALVTDDFIDFSLEEISASSENNEIQIYQAPSNSSASSTATAADETDYDEDIYASYHGYETLSSTEKKIYDGLKEASHLYYTGNGGTYEKTSSSGTTMVCLSEVSVSSSAGITSDDVTKVVSMFRNDNPIYFFLGSRVVLCIEPLPIVQSVKPQLQGFFYL
ncbi:MAG: hypothetical protein LIO74_11300 [Ruminococcus sp.]|nr:hypothetical protein [Ruminococcus sp.]